MSEIDERSLKINTSFKLIKPSVVPPLDEDFRPAVLANHAFLDEIADLNVGVPLLLGIERSDGYLSHFITQVFPEGHARADANLHYIERLVKFLLWQKGGWKIYVGGPRSIGKYIEECYAAQGRRQFDYQFMARHVYERPFTVVHFDPSEVPPQLESG